MCASALPLGAPFTEGFVRFRSPARHMRHQGDYAPVELAVFACDFGRLEPRPGLPSLTDCPGLWRRALALCAEARRTCATDCVCARP